MNRREKEIKRRIKLGSQRRIEGSRNMKKEKKTHYQNIHENTKIQQKKIQKYTIFCQKVQKIEDCKKKSKF